MDGTIPINYRRRRVAALCVAFALIGSMLIFNAGRSSATVPPAKTHLDLVKVCTKKKVADPTFKITNKTNKKNGQDKTPAGGPEVIDDVTIWFHGQQVGGPYTVNPGQTIQVQVHGVQWLGVFYARFTAKWRNQGEVAMEVRMTCKCDKTPDAPNITTTTTTTTTVPNPITTTTTFRT